MVTGLLAYAVITYRQKFSHLDQFYVQQNGYFVAVSSRSDKKLDMSSEKTEYRTHPFSSRDFDL